MTKKIFISLIILIAECIIYSFSEIRIPFAIIDKQNNDSAPLINKIVLNEIYSNLTFGTPPQIIQLNYKMDYLLFYLPSTIINTTNSETMNCTSVNASLIKMESVFSGYFCTDIIYINNTEKKVDFILNGKKGGNFGSIGLLLPTKVRYGIYPFFQSLHKNKIINSFTWTLKYFQNISLIDTINGNKTIGELIFGDEPHNYCKNIYSVDNYHVVSPIQDSGSLFWNLQFNDIYLTTKNDNITYIQGLKDVQLKPEANYLICPKEYYNTIKNLFFNKFLNEKICQEETIEVQYTYLNYFSCDIKNFNYENFPNLIFEHKILETKFNLTGNDLFVFDPKTNRYIFLILIYKYTLKYWIFGSPFFKKYQLIFNEDAKTIGYYAPKESNTEKEGNSILVFIVIICILSFILLTVFGILGIFIKKGIIQFPRKKRANELEENIVYEEKGNESKNENDIGINS